jgi:hypothetical protein
MARRQVLEIQCDRCGKTETQEIPKGDGDKAHEVELFVRFRGQEVKYSDLCLRCRGACEGYFQSITKTREKTTEEEKEPEPPQNKRTRFLR